MITYIPNYDDNSHNWYDIAGEAKLSHLLQTLPITYSTHPNDSLIYTATLLMLLENTLNKKNNKEIIFLNLHDNIIENAVQNDKNNKIRIIIGRTSKSVTEDLPDWQHLNIGPTIDYNIKEIHYKNNNLLIIVQPYITWQALFKVLAYQHTVFKAQDSENEVPIMADFYNCLVKHQTRTASTLFNEILQRHEVQLLTLQPIADLFASKKEHKLEALDRDIKSEMAAEADILNRLASCLSRLENFKMQYEILLNTPEEDKSQEVIEYIIKTPYIKDVTKLGTQKVQFQIEAPLKYYDSDLIKRFYKNASPVIQNLYKVLSNPDLEIYTYTNLRFNTQTFNINIQTASFHEQFIAQPHMMYYNCTGNHKEEIKAWITNRDYIGAITQIIAAAMNLNITDTTVVNNFAHVLKQNDQNLTIKHLPSDSFIHYKEALELSEHIQIEERN